MGTKFSGIIILAAMVKICENSCGDGKGKSNEYTTVEFVSSFVLYLTNRFFFDNDVVVLGRLQVFVARRTAEKTNF